MQNNSACWMKWVVLAFSFGFTDLVTAVEGKKPESICQFDDAAYQSLLFSPSAPVEQEEFAGLGVLIDKMCKAMWANDGIGIAANQIGVHKQIFIISPDRSIDPSTLSYRVFVNPVITHSSQEKICFWHGCLSAAGKPFGKVATWKTITVSACDGSGKPFSESFDGMSAIVIQHEFRHLLGGNYLQVAKEFKSMEEARQLAKEQPSSFMCECSGPLLLYDYQLGLPVDKQKKNTDPSDIRKKQKK
ncbi:Peptide deformylase [invertebrate metagenome]|uniref:Peptide deformylase n=1 Tax=invertebrate metagenome TaxID=1711999 RepID=A0A2H9TAE0_9ZZZZ